ncbi:MAG: hypothetical protein ACOCXT_00905 [Candidatus Dojkabacteria bacterium]
MAAGNFILFVEPEGDLPTGHKIINLGSLIDGTHVSEVLLSTGEFESRCPQLASDLMNPFWIFSQKSLDDPLIMCPGLRTDPKYGEVCF